MKKELFYVLLLVSFIGFGQCPNDDIYLTTQAEIDAFSSNFPNCTHLIKSLNIEGSDISNLNGLSQIQDVDEGIFIVNTNIENFSGLENIQNLSSSLIITENNSLVNFEGLQNLETITGQLAIALNGQIINFTGLNSLYSVGNGSDLGVLINSNDSLVSLEGLANLTQIYGSFRVEKNDLLENFGGLVNLESIYGWLGILDNDMLETLNGLENLLYCEDYISITGNASLSSVSSLVNLDSSAIIGVIVEDNPLLSFCSIAPICDAIVNPNTDVIINNNLAGCNSVPEVEAQCNLSITEADPSENLSFFPNPVSSILNIETPKNISFKKATVYSTLGKPILETSENQINFETLSVGIYFVEVITDKGVVTKKIVKQ